MDVIRVICERLQDGRPSGALPDFGFGILKLVSEPANNTRHIAAAIAHLNAAG